MYVVDAKKWDIMQEHARINCYLSLCNVFLQYNKVIVMSYDYY